MPQITGVADGRVEGRGGAAVVAMYDQFFVAAGL